jgi:hypothetical protein
MPMPAISFKRIKHGIQPNGDSWLATVVQGYLIPDYDLIFCSMEELEMRYEWKIIALASYIKSKVKEVGAYNLNVKTREISKILEKIE